MTSRDVLLVFVAGYGDPRGVDPVKLQHAMSIDSEVALPHESHYDFRPGPYGPWNDEYSRDLSALAEQGSIEESRAKAQEPPLMYRATAAGFREAMNIRTSASTSRLFRLFLISRFIESCTIEQLLQEFIGRHPEHGAYLTVVFKEQGRESLN